MKVLGTEYKLIHDSDLIKSGLDGECQSYSKVIRIRPKEQMLGDLDSDADKEKRYNEVKRHELVHAFLMNVVLMNGQMMKGLFNGLLHSFLNCLNCSMNRTVYCKGGALC